MTVSIAVPFRGDGGYRDRAWDYCRGLWEQTEFELCVGADEGTHPFNASRAFNDAVSKTTGDIIVLIGADTIPEPDHIRQVAATLADRPWMGVYRETAAYGESDTELILAGVDTTQFDFDIHYLICTGIIAMRREVWDDIGGMDERFIGWGYEDDALRSVLNSLHGPSAPSTGIARCLYHPPAEQHATSTNMYRYYNYRAAEDNPLLMRVLLQQRDEELAALRSYR